MPPAAFVPLLSGLHSAWQLSLGPQCPPGSLAQIAKLNIYLTDLSNFASVNQVMAEHFQPPYPARAAIGVSELPKGADVEMDAVLVLA